MDGGRNGTAGHRPQDTERPLARGDERPAAPIKVRPMSHPADTDGDWRALFDLPARGQPVSSVYLDTAAHAPMLRSARDAGVAALAGGNRPWTPDAPAWEARVERARALAAAWFDGDADAIAFVPSVAYGVAIASRNVPLARGEAVLVLDGQFPSNLRFRFPRNPLLREPARKFLRDFQRLRD